MTGTLTLVPLSSVTAWMSGGTPDRSIAEYWVGSIPWISAASLKGVNVCDSNQRVTSEAVLAGSKMAPVGATLILVRGMALHREVRAGIAMRPVSFNQDVKALIPSRSIVPRYLTYSIHARRSQILSLVTSAGSGTGVLETGALKRLEIWLPDPTEQATLVEIFDDLEAQVSVLERLIIKTQAIRQGIMQQLLTGRTRLPGFAKPRSEVRLGDHVVYIKTVALSRAQLDSDSPMRYLHYGDIHTSSDVVLRAAETPMPRASSALVGSAGRLQVGDVIFADASEDLAGVGKSVEIISVPNDGVIPGLHTIAARFNKGVLADGFKAYLQFIPEFRNALVRLAAGTKVLATTRSYISSIALELPEVDEQVAITQALRDSDDEIRAYRHRLTKAMAIKQGMMQELLTGRTRLPAEGGQHE
jgi:type I restriction enzyme S subunit